MEFVKTIDKNFDFKYDMVELVTIMEKFCSPSYLGKANVAKMMKLKGCKIVKGKYSTLEGSDHKLSFEKSDYLTLYEALTDKESKDVTFHTFLPFMYIFFLCRVCNYIEEKYTTFHKTLGINYGSKYSLLNLFIESGLSPEDLKRKCITYKMTEEAVVQQINNQSSNMSFNDIDTILCKIKNEMKVDFASGIEKEK